MDYHQKTGSATQRNTVQINGVTLDPHDSGCRPWLKEPEW